MKHRRCTRFMLLGLVLMLLAPLTVQAQPEMIHQYTQFGRPLFRVDQVSLLGDDPAKTRVLVYVDIAYEDLQFIRSGRGYEATYEVDLSVLAGEDEDAPRAANKLWKRTAVTTDFEETNSIAHRDVSETFLDLPGGTYTLVVTLTDLESKRNATVKETIQVPKYGLGSLEMSDLIAARQVRLTREGVYEIVPNVDKVVMDAKAPIFFYYEIYPDEGDSLDLHTRVLNEKGELLREKRMSIKTREPVTRHYQKLQVHDLPVGRYVYELQVSSGENTTLKAAHFRVHISGLPGSVSDINTAIRQLRYIARTSHLKKMQKAPQEQQEQMFRQFWKEKDPTPDTAENELMQEYYGRIERANVMFGSFREGWETDRGEVYIRFGPPSEVERHPYEIDSKPYEIWYYYEIQRRFVFVDELGYGEYRLVTNLWR